jgi:hypothetical protein
MGLMERTISPTLFEGNNFVPKQLVAKKSTASWRRHYVARLLFSYRDYGFSLVKARTVFVFRSARRGRRTSPASSRSRVATEPER